MANRPDLRDLTVNVREAFADCDRDALLDVLTFVVREYVAEGPPPMLLATEDLEDLRGLSFAEVITQMQLRLPHPEWGSFVVDGPRVGLRSGGAVHPVGAARLPDPAPAASAGESAQAASPTPPGERPAQNAPLAAAGLSVRGRSEVPAGVHAMAAPPQPTPSPSAGQAPSSATSLSTAPVAPPPAAAPDEPKPSGDDASARFQLLELD